MSFIRKIHKNGKTYLAEVENRWVDGKCVQKHLCYIGKEADGRTILTSSLSDVVVDEVKRYGPLLVLNHLAKQIDLPLMLGPRASEILSLVLQLIRWTWFGGNVIMVIPGEVLSK